jgi:hypothetical protein
MAPRHDELDYSFVSCEVSDEAEETVGLSSARYEPMVKKQSNIARE